VLEDRDFDVKTSRMQLFGLVYFSKMTKTLS